MSMCTPFDDGVNTSQSLKYLAFHTKCSGNWLHATETKNVMN